VEADQCIGDVFRSSHVENESCCSILDGYNVMKFRTSSRVIRFGELFLTYYLLVCYVDIIYLIFMFFYSLSWTYTG